MKGYLITLMCEIATLAALCPHLLAQSVPVRRQERWRFLAPSTEVSDDPRRVPVPPGVQGAKGILVLRGGRIFDGTGAPAHPGTLVIVGNKIKTILPATATATDWPKESQVIDVSGTTILPGLIDLHTHITSPELDDDDQLASSQSEATLRGVDHLRYFIESGITSIRDVASRGEVPFLLKAWISKNRLPGPRIFAAGQLITVRGGHSDEAGKSEGGNTSGDPITGDTYVASGPDQWREAVRVQFRRGADLIKIASHFSRPEVAAAVEEAHALGLKVTCDCETFYTGWAVEAGVDMIEHPLPRTDETIRLMAEKKVASDPTLMTYIILFNRFGNYYNSPSRRFTFSEDINFKLVTKLKNAGITLGVGTDLIDNWYQALPTPYIDELKQFVKLGYSVPQTLVAATKTNAELLDMGDKLGTLEPGKLADITVVSGQPDVTLDDLANVEIVIRDGYIEVNHGQTFIPRHVPIPLPKPWVQQ